MPTYVFQFSTEEGTHHARRAEATSGEEARTAAIEQARAEFPDVPFTSVTLAYIEDEEYTLPADANE